MDTRTGRIFTSREDARKKLGQLYDERYMMEMIIGPTLKQLERKPHPRIGRNELCPCGSGIKFKRCCLQKEGKIHHVSHDDSLARG
jgi:uncharacterized protein YecA (UPF0149 family)